MTTARHLAESVWYKESTKHLDKIPELTDEFEKILDTVLQDPVEVNAELDTTANVRSADDVQ